MIFNTLNTVLFLDCYNPKTVSVYICLPFIDIDYNIFKQKND